MVLYPFLHTPSGEEVDLDFPMGEAPSIGKTVKRGGVVFKRLASKTLIPKIQKDFFTNFQVRKGSTEATGADFYHKGRPCFTSRHNANEWARRKSGEGIVDIALED